MRLECPICGRTDFSGRRHLELHADKCAGGSDYSDSDMASDVSSDSDESDGVGDNVVEAMYSRAGEYSRPTETAAPDADGEEGANQRHCTVCYGDLPGSKLAVLDCCPHLYHYDCIMQWCKKGENKCCLCKKRIHRLVAVDAPQEPDFDSLSIVCHVRATR